MKKTKPPPSDDAPADKNRPTAERLTALLIHHSRPPPTTTKIVVDVVADTNPDSQCCEIIRFSSASWVSSSPSLIPSMTSFPEGAKDSAGTSDVGCADGADD
ncbi:hypothetical protein L6452_08525 [Arctium lappa]|uniref:Uncharacterized protein n=1 Tax=Arctium lappa TaxID=4217 RepID=A0ACB9DHI8_ARCLA|nr:hypothetical protein L6452_08525 [Arctium lappa]